VKISTKGRYGTRALVDIGQNYGKGPVSLRRLAERQGISMKYMEQIVALLRGSGLIRSSRGARGGYILAKKPKDILLRHILEALEGCSSVVDCLDDNGLCARAKECVTYEIWNEIQTAISKILDSTTLADIIQRNREKP